MGEWGRFNQRGSGVKAILLVLLVAVAGCERKPVPEDMTLAEARALYRVERFEACMKALPAGPAQTKYNDWAEVVSECDMVSYYQANARWPR
jgi:hypothetical protein